MKPKSWRNSDQVHTNSILKLDGMEPTREIRLFLEYVMLVQQMRHDVLNNFAEMPFFDPVIEDEVHVLRTCSLYEDYRHRLSQRAKTCIFVNLEELFTDASLIRETAKFLVRANSRRFPKEEVAKTQPLKSRSDSTEDTLTSS